MGDATPAITNRPVTSFGLTFKSAYGGWTCLSYTAQTADNIFTLNPGDTVELTFFYFIPDAVSNSAASLPQTALNQIAISFGADDTDSGVQTQLTGDVAQHEDETAFLPFAELPFKSDLNETWTSGSK